ncbi:hypothetical protein ACMD2_03087 [Ananas comosus]|uniref:Uncharacterized protein n=1 Tax=Ananas comosus TaxID=4615 RepID=A0A199VIH4_ANACO|nr:hypothetical protein ACMD2_03087 [Ananas comosus]
MEIMLTPSLTAASNPTSTSSTNCPKLPHTMNNVGVRRHPARSSTGLSARPCARHEVSGCRAGLVGPVPFFIERGLAAFRQQACANELLVAAGLEDTRALPLGRGRRNAVVKEGRGGGDAGVEYANDDPAAKCGGIPKADAGSEAQE